MYIYEEKNRFSVPGDDILSLDDPVVVHRRAGAHNDLLVLFVHGLGGSRYGSRPTWGSFPSFVFEDFPAADVGMYGYHSLFTRLRKWYWVELDVEARILADEIRYASQYSQVFLVGHSMGGLLCRLALAELIVTNQEDVLSRVIGVFLAATPQLGSEWWPKSMAFVSPDGRILARHNRYIQKSDEVLVDNIDVRESSQEGRHRVPTWALLGSSDFWVDRISGRLNLPTDQTRTIRGRHQRIVKPANKQDGAYAFFCSCLTKALMTSRQLDPTLSGRWTTRWAFDDDLGFTDPTEDTLILSFDGRRFHGVATATRVSSRLPFRSLSYAVKGELLPDHILSGEYSNRNSGGAYDGKFIGRLHLSRSSVQAAWVGKGNSVVHFGPWHWTKDET